MKPRKEIAWRRRLHAQALARKFQDWLTSKLFVIEQPGADL